MDLKIFPSKLQGSISAIPSKSQAHRLLICAAFSSSPTELVCPDTNEDIDKTDSKAVYTSRSGQPFYYEIVETDETEMFRDVLAGTIEDFEGLSKNDLISVLLDEVERILKEKE